MSDASEPHLFTVDVEEYFHAHAFEPFVSREEWPELPSRVDVGVRRLLDLLAEHRTVGTFFVLGWVAERRPDLIRSIAAAGHEIASHGWWHRRVFALTPDEFRADVRESKALLEDLAGRPVRGYRAPSFSIVPGCEWAFDVLLEEGYRYDSSLFPIRRKGYGYHAADPSPHRIRREGGELLEVPMATSRVGPLRLPAAGGAYLRLLPFRLSRRALRRPPAPGDPATLYVHPWEVDRGQPRLSVPWRVRFRHYGGLGRTLPRLRRLLEEFEFTSVERRLRVPGSSEQHETPGSAELPIGVHAP